MTTEIWYHGSSNLQQILDEGFDIDAPRIQDPGDFGWGIYLTSRVYRARYHSESSTILAVEIEIDRFAYIQNPYFLVGPISFARPGQQGQLFPKTFEEHLFFDIAFEATDHAGARPSGYEMSLVSGKHREEKSKLVRQVFMNVGYDGIITDHDGGEAVIFNTDAIVNIWSLEVPPPSEED